MRKIAVILLFIGVACAARASWYWPFGSSDEPENAASEKELPRISELMRPATDLIDEASDLATDGKIDEAVEKYRKALAELDRVEFEAGERAKGAEFATLRNKRAYVSAAIDTMLLSQVRENAKAVAVSDTAELEKKLAAERASKKFEEVTTNVTNSAEVKEAPRDEAQKHKVKKVKVVERRPKTRREQVIYDINRGDFAAAEALIKEMLIENPTGAAVLNLKAMMEMCQEKFKEAEATLDRAIASNPRNYFAYYNMANLMLQVHPEDKSLARRYYETGLAIGGPENAELEAKTK